MFVEFESGTLYFKDKPIGDIGDLILEEDVDESPVNEKIKRLSGGVGFESSLILCESDRNVLLSAIYGMQVTNNWLKMHGGVMSRKSWRKRARRKHGVLRKE